MPGFGTMPRTRVICEACERTKEIIILTPILIRNMARRIIYTVTKFVPPDRINEAAYLDLKNLFCIDPTYLVEPGHEKLFNKFKGEIIAVIIGSIFWILSLICKSALGYGTIVEILEAIVSFHWQ
jgi:hypothetical protein